MATTDRVARTVTGKLDAVDEAERLDSTSPMLTYASGEANSYRNWAPKCRTGEEDHSSVAPGLIRTKAPTSLSGGAGWV